MYTFRKLVHNQLKPIRIQVLRFSTHTHTFYTRHRMHTYPVLFLRAPLKPPFFKILHNTSLGTLLHAFSKSIKTIVKFLHRFYISLLIVSNRILAPLFHPPGVNLNCFFSIVASSLNHFSITFSNTSIVRSIKFARLWIPHSSTFLLFW